MRAAARLWQARRTGLQARSEGGWSDKLLGSLLDPPPDPEVRAPRTLPCRRCKTSPINASRTLTF